MENQSDDFRAQWWQTAKNNKNHVLSTVQPVRSLHLNILYKISFIGIKPRMTFGCAGPLNSLSVSRMWIKA